MTPAEIAAMVDDADDWSRVNGNHPVRGDELAKHVRALAAECERLQRSVDVNIELRILGGRAGTDFIKQRDQAESRAAEARDKSRRAAQIIIEEIGSIGPEDGDEAAKRSVAEIRKMRAQLEAVTREIATAKEKLTEMHKQQAKHNKWAVLAIDKLEALDRYKAALERIAENGTHHDLTPTKKMWGADRKPLDEANEIWWHAWIKRMDEQVKTIAREALKGAGQ